MMIHQSWYILGGLKKCTDFFYYFFFFVGETVAYFDFSTVTYIKNSVNKQIISVNKC